MSIQNIDALTANLADQVRDLINSQAQELRALADSLGAMANSFRAPAKSAPAKRAPRKAKPDVARGPATKTSRPRKAAAATAAPGPKAAKAEPSALEGQIVEYLRYAPPSTVGAIAAALGVDGKAASLALKRLRGEDRVVSFGKNRGMMYAHPSKAAHVNGAAAVAE